MRRRSSLAKLGEAIVLTAVWLRVKLWNLKEEIAVRLGGYTNACFRRADRRLSWLYLFRNPFRICRQFLEAQGARDIYSYGETPLRAMAKIAEECEVSKDDVFFELGCGRGRACFWVRCLRGCQVVGIDFVPPFIRAADWVVTKLGMSGIRFLEQDIRYVDYSKASVVYLYGTGFDRMTLESLAEALERLPIGAKVITVSYSMNDYSPTPCFKVEKIFPVHFNWGEGRVFYQSKQKAVY